jgi:hypothetical protein
VIPRDYISEWRTVVPWVQDFQVEQDLVISRALVEIFSHKLLRDALAFRGGTALYKLHLKPAARYSEDIDLVQTRAEAAGPTMERCAKSSIPNSASRNGNRPTGALLSSTGSTLRTRPQSRCG